MSIYVRSYRHVSDFLYFNTIADTVRLVTYLAVLQELDVPNANIIEALLNHARLKALVRQCSRLTDLGTPH